MGNCQRVSFRDSRPFQGFITDSGPGEGLLMTTVTRLQVNGAERRIDADPARSLLSVLRDDCDLTGSKYGCGEGRCGACTVMFDGKATRSCITPVGACEGKAIITI